MHTSHSRGGKKWNVPDVTDATRTFHGSDEQIHVQYNLYTPDSEIQQCKTS